MKKQFLLAIMLIFAAIFFSCNGSEFKAEIKTIDSLKAVLDSIQVKMGEVDTAVITKRYSDYLANTKLLTRYFNDKKEDSTWQIMTNYGALRTSLKPFAKNYTQFYTELEYSRKQLDSLKGDVEAGNLEKEKIREYTKSESDAVINLKTLVTSAVENAKTGMKLLDSLNPKVEKVVEKLKKENKTENDKSLSEEKDD